MTYSGGHSMCTGGEDCVGDIFWKGQHEDNVDEVGRRKKRERRQPISEWYEAPAFRGLVEEEEPQGDPETGSSEVRRKPGKVVSQKPREASISRRKWPFMWNAAKRWSKVRTEEWPLDLAVWKWTFLLTWFQWSVRGNKPDCSWLKREWEVRDCVSLWCISLLGRCSLNVQNPFSKLGGLHYP